MTSTILRGNLVTEMSLVNDKLSHKAYYQGLLKRVTTTLRLISILSDEWFLHTSKESTVTNTVCTRITWIDWNLLASGKFMQFHLILWLYGGAQHRIQRRGGGGGARNMQSMWPPLAAIFFMTCLYRAWGGAMAPSAPPWIRYWRLSYSICRSLWNCNWLYYF